MKSPPPAPSGTRSPSPFCTVKPRTIVVAGSPDRAIRLPLMIVASRPSEERSSMSRPSRSMSGSVYSPGRTTIRSPSIEMSIASWMVSASSGTMRSGHRSSRMMLPEPRSSAGSVPSRAPSVLPQMVLSVKYSGSRTVPRYPIPPLPLMVESRICHASTTPSPPLSPTKDPRMERSNPDAPVPPLFEIVQSWRVVPIGTSPLNRSLELSSTVPSAPWLVRDVFAR